MASLIEVAKVASRHQQKAGLFLDTDPSANMVWLAEQHSVVLFISIEYYSVMDVMGQRVLYRGFFN